MADDIDVFSLSPDDQLHIFNRTSLLKTLIFSLLIHVLVIGGMTAASMLEPPATESSEDGDTAAASTEDEPDTAGGGDGEGTDETGGTGSGTGSVDDEASDTGGADDGETGAGTDLEDTEKGRELQESEDPLTDPADELPLDLAD